MVQPKMKILSSFTHPQVVPNQYEFLLWNVREEILNNVGNHQAVACPHWLSSMYRSVKYFRGQWGPETAEKKKWILV